MFALISALFMLCSVAILAENLNVERNVSSLPPIVFLPGLTGSRLYATVESESHIPASCVDQNIPINTPFVVMFNVTLMAKAAPCMYDLLKMNFNNNTKTFSDQPGIRISTQNFGGFSGVEAVYWTFPKDTAAWGYKLNVNLFGAPFDYRYMSAKSFENNGFFQQLKDLIEKAYLLNDGKRILLVGHSNGGPTMYSFLTSGFVTQAWKNKFIGTMVGLSGNFLGQMNMLKGFSYSPSSEEQEMLASWEASYGSATYGAYPPTKDITVIRTHTSTSGERKYTARYEDVLSLLEGHEDWQMRYAEVYKSTMNRVPHPKVNIDCLYGVNVSTEYQFQFKGDINAGEKYTTVLEMDGDGNQDIFDNAFCNVWNTGESRVLEEKSRDLEEKSRVSADKFEFSAVEFPGVHHMGMVSNQDVLNKLYEIVQKYNV